MTLSVVDRLVGTCQICGGEFKAPGGVIALHGYRRPGWGHTVGRCHGSDRRPYELTCDDLRNWATGLQASIDDKRALSDRLSRGEADVLYVDKGWGRNASVEAVRPSDGEVKWRRALAENKSRADATARGLQQELRDAERRIAAWRPMPMRSVVEVERAEAASKAQRASERDAKRVAAEAKRAATAAKTAEREARNAVIVQQFVDRFKALAAEPPSADRNARALAVWKEMQRPKNQSAFRDVFLFDLGLNEEFKQLGLLVISPEGYRRWAGYEG